MTIPSEVRISSEELTHALVGNVDQILDGLIATLLEIEPNEDKIRINEQMHQQDKYPDVLLKSSLKKPAYSEQLTRRLGYSFSQRKQFISQSSVRVAAA